MSLTAAILSKSALTASNLSNFLLESAAVREPYPHRGKSQQRRSTPRQKSATPALTAAILGKRCSRGAFKSAHSGDACGSTCAYGGKGGTAHTYWHAFEHESSASRGTD